jgi:hypothetical protein
MKKCIAFLVVLFLAAGFAAAEGIGLSVGLEFGLENINKANDEDMNPYLMPRIIYENSFLDDALDLYAEMNYKFGFDKAENDDGDEVIQQSMYLDLMVGYNLGLGSASTLSFILENEFDELIISPRLSSDGNLKGVFIPAVKFTQTFDFGDLFAKVGVPITYSQYVKDADTQLGLDFTLGWNSTFGLGIEAKICTLFMPGEDAGYNGFETTISFETEPIYVEVEVIIHKEISDEGIKITPEFDFSLGRFTFYAKCEIAGVGKNGSDAVISPGLGVKFSF